MAGGRKHDPVEARERRENADMRHLVTQPQFSRFMWRVIQASGLFARVTDGSRERDLGVAEGARNLGLAILEMVELGQPATHPNGMPILTLLQALREEANPSPSERDDEEGRNDQRYDRNAELDDGDEDHPHRR
jgi:hypothetical protein